MTSHDGTDPLDDMEELVRQTSERALLQSLETKRLAVIAVNREADNRWGMFFLLLVMLGEMLQPIRFMLMYEQSWAHKVARFNGMDYVLPMWLVLCAMSLVPLIMMFWLQPRGPYRRRAIGLASAGMCGSAFAFGYMALVVSQFDAPQVADQWIVSAISCVVVMLLFTATVNNANRKQPVEKVLAQLAKVKGP